MYKEVEVRKVVTTGGPGTVDKYKVVKLVNLIEPELGSLIDEDNVNTLISSDTTLIIVP